MSETSKTRLNFSLDFRIIIFVLLAIIAGMLVAWMPWQSSANSGDRTISVSGQAKITAEPDEFVFYPNYEFKNADKSLALAELTKKSDEIIAKLKKLGLRDSQIKSNAVGNDYGFYYAPDTNQATYTLSLTIKLAAKAEAQKVQDYLLTTNPSGSVSPQPSFSDAKQKELEAQARDKATKEARSKADQSAKNLGFRVGKVKSVEDGLGFNGPEKYSRVLDGDMTLQGSDAITKLDVQPGQNDLDYSVTVIYYLR